MGGPFSSSSRRGRSRRWPSPSDALLGVLFPSITPDRYGWFPQADLCIRALGCTDPSAAIQLGLTPQRLLGLATVWLLTWVNLRGVREGKLVQTTLTIVKAGALAMLIILGFTIGRNGTARSPPTSARRIRERPVDHGRLRPRGGSRDGGIALLERRVEQRDLRGGGGAESAREPSARAGVRDGAREPAVSARQRRRICSVLPLHGAADGASVLARGIAHATQDRVGTAAVEQMFGTAGATIMAVAILVSTFGCNNGLILAGARVYFAMARDRLFFRRAATLNAKAVPSFALIVQSVWVSLLCLTGTYGQLLDYVIFAALLFYVLTTIGLFILRVKRPDIERPYRAVGYPVLPALYVLLAGAVSIILLIAPQTRTQAIFGLVLVLIGIPVYALWRRAEAA